MMTTRLSLAAMLLFCSGASVRADVVLDWNRVASDVLVANTALQNPGMASRTMAMMNVAMYDGLGMMNQGSTLFYNYGGGHASPAYAASGEAAAAQAAYTVLSNLYSDQQGTLDAALSASLAGVPDGAAKTEGLALGTMIGQSIINRRANDGYDTMSQYMPSDGPGRWRPDPLNPDQEAWGPAWGDVTPFAIASNTQFTPPPMPALTSQEYADAFDEVRRLGSVDSTERTQEETNIGLFWAYDRSGMGTPMRLYNNILREVAEQEGNTTKENAELFAKASVAMADAGIVAWNSKFEYDFWRPVTGIREADTDGNPDTVADPDWTPLGAPAGGGTDFTPPFPTYLSGHATFGGAVFEALELFYGTDDISFTIESDELPGQPRTFQSFSEAMAENGRSRVYLGIHWNFDDTVARDTGGDVAQYLMGRSFIASVPEPATIGQFMLLAAAALTRRRRKS